MLEPQLTLLPELDSNNVMRLAGYFPSVPFQVNFDLQFAAVEGRWRLLGIAVNVGQPTPAAPQPEPAKPEAKPLNRGRRLRSGSLSGYVSLPAACRAIDAVVADIDALATLITGRPAKRRSSGQRTPSRTVRDQIGAMKRYPIAQVGDAELTDEFEVGAPMRVVAAFFHFIDACPATVDGRVAVLDPCREHKIRIDHRALTGASSAGMPTSGGWRARSGPPSVP